MHYYADQHQSNYQSILEDACMYYTIEALIDEKMVDIETFGEKLFQDIPQSIRPSEKRIYEISHRMLRCRSVQDCIDLGLVDEYDILEAYMRVCL